MHVELSKSHNFIVRSLEHDAKRVPLSLKDIYLTELVCPLNCFSILPWSNSQTLIDASSDAEQTKSYSG